MAARDRETARRAAQAVKVEYEVLKPLTDLTLAANSPVKIHAKGNLLKETIIKRGDPVEKVLARSAHVVRGVFETPFVEHAFLETEAAVALPIEGHRLRVFSQSQGIFKDREQIASVLGLPEERVDVVQVSSGGGFGGKEDLTVQHHRRCTATCFNCPVKVRLSRPESIRMHPKRHRMIMDYALGCNAQGKLTALRARTVGDTGAYASVGGEVVARTGTHAAGAYHVPHVDVKASAYYTNNPPGGAFRGFGVNQATFAMESLVDQLCAEGASTPGSSATTTPWTQGLMTTTGQVWARGWGSGNAWRRWRSPSGRALCRLGCAIKNCGIGNGLPEVSETRLRVEGAPADRTVPRLDRDGPGGPHRGPPDPDPGPGPGPGGGDRGGVLHRRRGPGRHDHGQPGHGAPGRSIMEAAEKLRTDLEKSSLAQLTGREYEGRFMVDWTTGPDVPGEIVSHFAYGYAVHLVCLDRAGRLEAVHAAHDVGRIINPALFQGQVQGGVVMGAGLRNEREAGAQGRAAGLRPPVQTGAAQGPGCSPDQRDRGGGGRPHRSFRGQGRGRDREHPHGPGPGQRLFRPLMGSGAIRCPSSH